MSGVIKPGYFSKTVAADKCRMEYDFKNEEILSLGEKPDFLFIGDSITQLWEINAYFRDNGLFLVNRGIGGDTTEYLLKRFKADALQLKPRYIIMLIGVNDMFAIDGDAWWRKEGEVSSNVGERIIKNIKAIVNMCKAKEQKIILCSILPSDIVQPYKKEERNKLIIDVNYKIKDICEENKLIYVDYHSAMAQENGRTLVYDYSPDGIHPNARGYKVMAAILRSKLVEKGIKI